MRWHWQNLAKEDRALISGRGWLYVGRWTFRIAWCSRPALRFCVEIDPHNQGLSISLGCGPCLWLGLEPLPNWMARLLPGRMVELKGREPWLMREARNLVSLSVHSGSLWWEFWTPPMEWSSSTPKWQHGNFNPADFVLGRHDYEMVKGPKVATLVPMPEGAYPATIERNDQTWKRPRWPFARKRTSYWLEIPGGIPHMGKGENSWDCGEDGLWATGGDTPEQAIGNAVASVLRSRERHGVGPTAKARGVKLATAEVQP